ncbi:hypothetical protein HDV63DRAFT_415266 [Trichoderma sp. SZMC 28014]
MDTDDEDSVKRGFVLEPINGRYRATPLSTVGELQFHLLSTSRTIVLPGKLDEATAQVLTDSGVSHKFLKAYLEDATYSSRGSRPQDAIATYCWRIPQFVKCCGECTKCATEEFEDTTNSRGPVVLLRVSLWISKQRNISVLLVQQSDTDCENMCIEAPVDPSLEDELREKVPHAGLEINISIPDYVNQLACERWAEYIAEFTIDDTSPRLLWDSLRLIEQNFDTARHIALRGGAQYLASEQPWEDLLRRLDRRMRYRYLPQQIQLRCL